MTVDIQYVQMPVSESLSEIVTKNLKKLESKYQSIIRANVFFKLENDPTGEGKVCEMELSTPGPRIFAKSNENNFEKAAATTLRDLERQLKKRKDKFKKRKGAI